MKYIVMTCNTVFYHNSSLSFKHSIFYNVFLANDKIDTISISNIKVTRKARRYSKGYDKIFWPNRKRLFIMSFSSKRY